MLVVTLVVEAHQLSKVYEPTPKWMRLLARSYTKESVVALRDVTLTVAAGQILVVIGPNGAGKSTLFRILTGLTTPSTGRATILGMDPETQAHRIRRLLGFMPAEDRTLILRLTCRENLRFHGRLQGLSEKTLLDKIDSILEVVGLLGAGDWIAFALSSGMRARLMLARAMLHEPQVLILDEPTGSIDPIGAHDFLQLIREVTAKRGIATLISSHRLEEIEALRENVLLLDRGSVIHKGNLNETRGSEEAIYEIICVDEHAANRVLKALGDAYGPGLASTGRTISIAGTDPMPEHLTSILHVGPDIESVSRRVLSLRETIAGLLAQGRLER